jgi:hypothetical protein
MTFINTQTKRYGLKTLSLPVLANFLTMLRHRDTPPKQPDAGLVDAGLADANQITKPAKTVTNRVKWNAPNRWLR